MFSISVTIIYTIDLSQSPTAKLGQGVIEDRSVLRLHHGACGL